MQETHLSSTMRLFFWFRLTVMVIVWQTIYSTINDRRLQLFLKISATSGNWEDGLHNGRETERHAMSLNGRKILNSFCTSIAKEILRSSRRVTYGCSITRTRWGDSVRRVRHCSRDCKAGREPELFQSTAFHTDKFPKSPRSYCKYLHGRKLRENSIISSILALMNRATSQSKIMTHA